MSSFGSQMRKRLEKLHKQGQNVPKIMEEVMTGATIAAVEKAVSLTPPNGNTQLSGTNTRTGDLAQHWTTDSNTQGVYSGGSVKTVLANELQYASYVNDGHVMDQHYVPGLIVNEYSGMLEKVDPDVGGIVVGTQTQYVKGTYARQAAIGKFRDTLRSELGKKVREGLQ